MLKSVQGCLVRFGLVSLSGAMLTLAFAPLGQFYLAWIGLVPWLVATGSTRSSPRAFGWGWLGGVVFFALSMSWLARATLPGTVALVMYLSLFWGLAAAIIRGCGWMDRSTPRSAAVLLGSVLAIASAWTAAEWLRATVLTGLPWVLLGQSQTPLLAVCQIADVTGIYGVSFILMAVNAMIALAIVRGERRQLVPAAAGVAALLIGVIAYGVFRLSQEMRSPGPRIMVVQPDHRHERGGARTITQEQQIEFHFGTTERALADLPPDDRPDLVVWSETVMPPLNPEARQELRNESSGPFLAQVDEQLRSFARRHGVALVAGAYYVGGWEQREGTRRIATDIRNAVYLYHPDGSADPGRYDKIHLVPFGEFLPFEHSFPPLYRVLRYFAAPSVDYSIRSAPANALTVFQLRAESRVTGALRFVTPICFEDVDGALVARMFRPGPDGAKRADLIVNVTNDGWFLGHQQAQHLQSAIFRSIENRVPTARASNTGISGFIDSAGRTQPEWLIPARTAGTLTYRVGLDARVTPYSRVGDLFAWICVAASAAIAGTRAFTRFTAFRNRSRR